MVRDTNKEMERIGSILRQARKKRHLRGRDAAASAGISYQTFLDIEKGRGYPGLGKMSALAALYGMRLTVEKDPDLHTPSPNREGQILKIF